MANTPTQTTEHDEPEILNVRGVDTAFRRGGSGEPLLFLHGSGMTKRWLPIHESLAASFDVIAPEHPGYGDTVRPRWYRSLDDMAVHYDDLLDELGLDTVHLVGQSFGGCLAGAFAGLFPKRLRSLTLMAPGPLQPGGSPWVPSWATEEELDMDQLLFNGNKDAYPQYLDADDDGIIVAEDDGTDPFADPDAWYQNCPPSLYKRLSRVSCPCVVLAPDEDRVIPSHFFDEWAKFLPGASVVQVPGSDLPTAHAFHVQEPDAIALEVRRVAGLA